MAAERQIAALRAALTVIIPGAGPVTDLIKALLDLAQGRAEQLDRLERKIDDVRDEEFRRGTELLQEARAVPSEAPRNIALAADKFAEAHAKYEQEPEKSWWAALYVAALSYTLGNTPKARYWLPQAHAEAARTIETRCVDASRLSIGRVNVGARRAALGSRAAVLTASAIGCLSMFVAYVFLVFIHPVVPFGTTTVGIIAWTAVCFVLLKIVFAVSELAPKAEEDTGALFYQRFDRFRAAAEELDSVVQAMEGFAMNELDMQGVLPHYVLSVVPERLEMTYSAGGRAGVPISAPAP